MQLLTLIFVHISFSFEFISVERNHISYKICNVTIDFPSAYKLYRVINAQTVVFGCNGLYVFNRLLNLSYILCYISDFNEFCMYCTHYFPIFVQTLTLRIELFENSLSFFSLTFLINVYKLRTHACTNNDTYLHFPKTSKLLNSPYSKILHL